MASRKRSKEMCNTDQVKVELMNKGIFHVGENVLCYEPDPSKTKVLYDSKILKSVIEKDDQGQNICKFLVHFKGWNSKWDRLVTGELILKDTEENRKLQKEFAKEVEHIKMLTRRQCYGRSVTAHNSTRTSTITSTHNSTRNSTSENSVPQTVEHIKDENVDESEEDESVEDEDVEDEDVEDENVEYESVDENVEDESVEDENVSVPNNCSLPPNRTLPALDFPEILKFHMEYSFNLIQKKNYLIKLPCQPNVVTLFENYLKYFARTYCDYNRIKTPKAIFNNTPLNKRLDLCIEVLDGLRICFNYYLLNQLLINDDEQAQHLEAIRMSLEPPKPNTNVLPRIGHQPDPQNNVPNDVKMENLVQGRQVYVSVQNETLQTTHANSSATVSRSRYSKVIQNTIDEVHDDYVSKADLWKAVPDTHYFEEIKEEAIIYGINHLLRLLDLLPKILSCSILCDEKLAVIYSVANDLLKYLATRKDLFGINQYGKRDRMKKNTTLRTRGPVMRNRRGQ